MSQENVDRYLRGTELWNRGDLDGWLAEVTPGWEWHTSGAFLGVEPIYRGVEGAQALWDVMRSPWAEFTADIDRIKTSGTECSR